MVLNDDEHLKNCFDAIKKYKENEKNKPKIVSVKKNVTNRKINDNDSGIVRSLNTVRNLQPENRRKGMDMLDSLEKGHNRGRGR